MLAVVPSYTKLELVSISFCAVRYSTALAVSSGNTMLAAGLSTIFAKLDPMVLLPMVILPILTTPVPVGVISMLALLESDVIIMLELDAIVLPVMVKSSITIVP